MSKEQRFPPPEEHKPEFIYDCEFCKFNWQCGFTCLCILDKSKEMPMPPRSRQKEVNDALIEAGYEPEFLGANKRNRGR